MHPGLCRTVDAEIYGGVIQFAKNIERAMTNDNMHTFFRFTDVDSDRSLVVYLAHVRARRPYAQQTHVFASCDVIGERNQKHIVELRHRDESAMYEYASVWMIGKHFLSADCTHIELHEGTHRWHAMQPAPQVPMRKLIVPIQFDFTSSLACTRLKDPTS